MSFTIQNLPFALGRAVELIPNRSWRRNNCVFLDLWKDIVLQSDPEAGKEILASMTDYIPVFTLHGDIATRGQLMYALISARIDPSLFFTHDKEWAESVLQNTRPVPDGS